MLKVLSLGAGVQSSTVLLMSCRGDLPKLDAAIFADTQWEPRAVYEHLDWLEAEAAKSGIPIHRVSAGNLRADAIAFRQYRKADRRYASMPLFVLNPDGSQGIIRRQCTKEYKIEPVKRKLRELLGFKSGERVKIGRPVELWMGISVDELYRISDSRVKWIKHVYPLVDMLPKRFTRQSCIQWLSEHYPDRSIPRSACIGCPFHSNREWAEIKTNPGEWSDAVEFDQAIREADQAGQDAKGLLVGLPFVHRSCKPLDQVDVEEKDQGRFWDEECTGYCGN